MARARKVRLCEELVKEVFETATSQAEYLLALYDLVIPDWDRVTCVNGWPSVNDFTWKAIARLCMDKDNALQKGVEDDAQRYMAGGGWLNRGFSTSHGEKLRNWEVSLEGCKVTYAD